jgi:amino acid permease
MRSLVFLMFLYTGFGLITYFAYGDTILDKTIMQMLPNNSVV